MYVHYGLSWHVQRGEIIATLACCELRKGTPLRLARKSSGLNRSISASTEHKLFHSNTVRCLCKSGRETNHAPICQHMFHSRWADSMPVTRDMQSECQRTKSLVVIGGCNCHVPMTCFSSLDLFYGLIVLYSIESIAPQFCTRKKRLVWCGWCGQFSIVATLHSRQPWSEKHLSHPSLSHWWHLPVGDEL